MKVGRKFNVLKKSEYVHLIDNHKKYSDFNTLGLYRSICENDNLELYDKIEIRDYANKYFGKTFNFYQLKDPKTFFDLTTLGREMTQADESQVWTDIKRNQEKILSEKRIKHRSFGEYSKHNCGYENCPYDGLMIKQGSWLTEAHMRFDFDRDRFGAKEKSDRNKKQRKAKHKTLKDEFDNEEKADNTRS